jgi:HlyD family secretion protein
MAAVSSRKKSVLLVAVAALVLALLVWWLWAKFFDAGPGPGFASGNGRLEATEIAVATKLPGRVQEVLADEGDSVKAGQVLARMNVDSLKAQLAEAQAGLRRARDGEQAAQAQVELAEAQAEAGQAQVALRQAELDAAQRRLARARTLAGEGAASQQELDDARALTHGTEAGVAAAKAQAVAARAAVDAARAQQVGARSQVEQAEATVARVQSELDDSVLAAPRAGRVQYRVAEPGEVIGAGGRVLSLVDLGDVYMTFFLPEEAAGKLKLGSEVRLLLDADGGAYLPARVSYVADVAQFTPKTVETASERQKLMFRIKARLDPQVLARHLARLKTGVPGVAWVRLDPSQPWPESLSKPLAD